MPVYQNHPNENMSSELPVHQADETTDDLTRRAQLLPPFLPQEEAPRSQIAPADNNLHTYHETLATAEPPLGDTRQPGLNVPFNSTSAPSSGSVDEISSDTLGDMGDVASRLPCSPHMFSEQALEVLGFGSYGHVYRVLCSKCNEVTIHLQNFIASERAHTPKLTLR